MLKRRRFWIGLLVGLAFLSLFLYRTDFANMGRALAQANYLFLLPAVAAYFVAVWFRTLRWQLLLFPLGRVSQGRLFPVVVIGYMANNILPVRLGELARAYLLGEKEGMSKAAVLATVVVERLLDGVALLFFLLLVLPFLPLARWLGDLGGNLGLSPGATLGLFLALAALFLGLLLLFLLVASWPGLGRGVAGLLERRLPGGMGKRGSQLLTSFLGGLGALHSPGQLLAVFLISCLVWLAEAVMYYLITFSFQLGQPFSVLLLGTAAANLAISLPSLPGGIGPFEFVFQQTLISFGTLADRATAYTIVLHATLLLPVTLLGFYYLWAENLSLSRMVQPEARPAPDSGEGRRGEERMNRALRVGVLGGGIAGLTAAYELAKRGHKVTLFERRPQLGGQVGTFPVGGGRLEGFYHHIFTTDSDLLNLLQELGLSHRLLWLDSRVGFLYQGRLYNFVTPWDLLRFTPVGLRDRLRLGLVGLRLRRLEDWRSLEGITAREWIIQHAGERNYQVVWGPLLRGKFGEFHDQVGMVWFWGKIHLRFASRSPGMQREKLGYLEGSFGLLVDALARRIGELGGTVLTSTTAGQVVVEGGRVAGLQVEGPDGPHFHPLEAVLATIPSQHFLSLAPQLPADYADKLRQVRYLGALCLVLVLKNSLSPIYWLNISDPDIPFVLAVEHTNFMDRSHYGGKHILYLSNYLDTASPLYRAEPREVLDTYLPHLRQINPQFAPEWVKEYHLFRDEAGQPVITPRYLEKMPPHRTPIPGLYLANTTQIYPHDRGMNFGVRLAREVSSLVDSGP